MTLSSLRLRLRTRRFRVIATLVVVVAIVITVIAVLSRTAPIRTRSQFVTGTPEAGRTVRLDTTLYLPAHTPAPAVLLAHGFGETKDSEVHQATTLAEHGYVVLAYSARGFGRSGGLIHLDAPKYEVHDASLLVTYLAGLPQVARQQGRPRIAVAGSSYGGALALLLAGTDHRIEAVAADITWNNLAQALFPNAAGSAPGVFKKLWAGYLFQDGFGFGGSSSCGRFAANVCAAYQYAARTGRPNAALLKLLNASSPSTVLSKITAPTLLTQGEQDSLFPLSQADANARGIAAHGTPVRVVWRTGGHDDPSDGNDTAMSAMLSWFGQVFGSGVHGRQPFDISTRRTGNVPTSVADGARVLRVASYPGIDGTPVKRRTIRVRGPKQKISAPAGGNPAAITALPVIGSLLDQAGDLGVPGFDQLSAIPGQIAVFGSSPLSSSMTIAGSSTVSLTVTARTSTDADLFVALRDVAPDGTEVLPGQLVAPLRLTGMRPGTPRTVTVHLPTITTTVPAGDRLVLTVSTTDLAYQTPLDPRLYAVALPGGSTAVAVPVVTGSVIRAGFPAAWLIVGLVVCVIAAAGVTFELRRRRRVVRGDPDLVDVPVSIAGLVKEYAGGYRAVDGVSFRVERGQVVGLLGPNGAGKTTTLRVLVGLIRPTSGVVHVFGEPIVPGAAVLARLGAFIEGPGFLPHLTGRDNLRLYWAATGRPFDEAQFDTALDIAGMGASIDRRVSAYSHGMKQRLGIAQAMLGLPEVLVLDEPTNGLDPPQIAEMREVLQAYATSGRTVVVSSHLLAEVEQTCTHVVVMHKGRLVAAGSVLEIAGAGGQQLAVDDPARALAVLAAAGIDAQAVPARRALEDVFLGLVGADE